MQLWQMDVTASAFLTDGTELKIVTGIDDHSRFCVIAKVVRRATLRPVCRAFVDAMATYGIPDEVLTDNGLVFTGRFIKPRPPVEVLFDRICRENGIRHLLTKPRSPTTTGKIERLHQTLQEELLSPHGPFATVDDAQAAVDAWRAGYNADRPHQSLGMGFPASRFAPKTAPSLPLVVPGPLTAAAEPAPAYIPEPVPKPDAPAAVVAYNAGAALELERVVPASGNLWVGGQQIWLGPLLAGRTVTLWVDTTDIHVIRDGVRLKTLYSRLGVIELARLAADGQARPAGPSPFPRDPASPAVELDRTVNRSGTIGIARRVFGVGQPLAGRRVTVRLEGRTMQIHADGVLLRTLACPIPVSERHRLHGARIAGPAPEASSEPLRVQRRVSVRGAIMITSQRVHVGLTHARKTATVIVEANQFRIFIDEKPVLVAPRTNTKEVSRYKIYTVRKNV